jgi:hypothetical protein
VPFASLISDVTPPADPRAGLRIRPDAASPGALSVEVTSLAEILAKNPAEDMKTRTSRSVHLVAAATSLTRDEFIVTDDRGVAARSAILADSTTSQAPSFWPPIPKRTQLYVNV